MNKYELAWSLRHPPMPEPTLESMMLNTAKNGECLEYVSNCANGRAMRLWKGRRELVYRIVYELAHGVSIPMGMEIDHTCHNGGCINPAHLRLATRLQNARNQKLYSVKRVPLKGVGYTGISYTARIFIDGEQVHLGCYKTAKEAHEAYCRAAKDAFGEFMCEG